MPDPDVKVSKSFSSSCGSAIPTFFILATCPYWVATTHAFRFFIFEGDIFYQGLGHMVPRDWFLATHSNFIFLFLSTCSGLLLLSLARSLSLASSLTALSKLQPFLVREASKNEGGLLSDITPAFSECNVNCLHNIYNISWESFWIFALSPRVRANNLIPAGDTIIALEEQLKVGICFPLDPFFVEILRFHKLSVVQLHPMAGESWWPFQFVCLNNHIEPSVALFSRLY